MHFLKYVEVIILFYSILFMWTRCGYQMSLCAPPPVPMTILISFTLALPRPLSHTRCRRGTRGTERSGHVHMVRLAILAVTPPLPSSHQVFPYKQPIFTVSSVVPVECWKSDPSLQFWLLTMVVKLQFLWNLGGLQTPSNTS